MDDRERSERRRSRTEAQSITSPHRESERASERHTFTVQLPHARTLKSRPFTERLKLLLKRDSLVFFHSIFFFNFFNLFFFPVQSRGEKRDSWEGFCFSSHHLHLHHRPNFFPSLEKFSKVKPLLVAGLGFTFSTCPTVPQVLTQTSHPATRDFFFFL